MSPSETAVRSNYPGYSPRTVWQRSREISVLVVVSLRLPFLLSSLTAAPAKPNFIIIFVDNFGNGDLRCFNPATPHRTPHVDRLAAVGTKFTSFYVASGVCTRSRAAGHVENPKPIIP